MTTFIDLFEEYAASSLDKQWTLGDMLGDHDWQLDLEAGTITFNRLTK
jgi:hypothetical protein